MIYLASPYTDPSAVIMDQRYEAAMHCTALMLRRRMYVYSPIVHCHELAKRHELPRDFEFWQKYDLHMLDRSSQILVLKLPGWQESRGVTAELAHARSTCMPRALVEVVKDDLVYEVLED